MITIGRMAEKYHMLPSQVEANATTYDFMITDVLAAYDQYQLAKVKGNGTLDPKMYKLSQEQLLEIKNKTIQDKK
jgi:hypothetical protein